MSSFKVKLLKTLSTKNTPHFPQKQIEIPLDRFWQPT